MRTHIVENKHGVAGIGCGHILKRRDGLILVQRLGQIMFVGDDGDKG